MYKVLLTYTRVLTVLYRFFHHDTPEAVDRFVGYVKARAGRE